MVNTEAVKTLGYFTQDCSTFQLKCDLTPYPLTGNSRLKNKILPMRCYKFISTCILAMQKWFLSLSLKTAYHFLSKFKRFVFLTKTHCFSCFTLTLSQLCSTKITHVLGSSHPLLKPEMVILRALTTCSSFSQLNDTQLKDQMPDKKQNSHRVSNLIQIHMKNTPL